MTRFFRVRRLQTAARALGVSITSALVPRKYRWYLPTSLYSNAYWHRKCIEPVKRKHGKTYPEWQVHRFEIKGGISWNEAWMRDMSAPNPFLGLLAEGLRTPDRSWFTPTKPLLIEDWRYAARVCNIETSEESR